MTFEKKQLARADMGYAVSTMRILGEERVIVASENTGPAVVFAGEHLTPHTISTEPGGCMGFASVPGRDDALFMITRFYPIFKSEAAGIAMITAKNGLREPWDGNRIIDLPFVHRIASVSTNEGKFLVAATVCESKEFQDDWSKPGAVYAFAIDDDSNVDKDPTVLLDGIHRNHGMSVGRFRDVESLLISADEGVFALSLPGATDQAGRKVDAWTITTVLQHAVSEIALFDFDGDGTDEIATIEPFHGDKMAIYKDTGSGWEEIFSDKIAFGHGLTAGSLSGKPSIVLGNRSETKDLVCYQVSAKEPFTVEKSVIDHGSGSAGTAIIATPSGGEVVTSNAEFAEYALYTPTS